jgi:hypothetical protein
LRSSPNTVRAIELTYIYEMTWTRSTNGEKEEIFMEYCVRQDSHGGEDS